MGNNHSKSKRRRWIILGIVGVVVIAGIFGIASAMQPSHAIDPSKLAKVERGDITRSVVATGTIEPLTKVEVKSKASGIVKQIFVDYGDRVKKDQVLVELDKEQLQASVDEQRANLQAAEAAVQSAEATYQRNLVDAEGPDVPFLKATVERDRKLAADGILSASSMDDAEKAYQLAVNKQMSARRNVTVSQAEVARAKAQVAQAKASLQSAEEDFRNATILSPMDGIVLSRDVEVGDAVSSILVLGSQATLLMTLGDMSTVYVLGKVDQADIGSVYLGQPAHITVESFKNKKFDGKVTKISPMGVEKDNVTTFEVRVSIENPTGELKANMSANAELVIQEKHDTLLIPEGAVFYDAQKKPFAEIPDAREKTGWRKEAIQVGITNGIKAEVDSGLKEGEQVVLQ
jgi:HlyD family secretion protein